MQQPCKKGPWTRLSSTEVYNNRWIRVNHESVITPAGSEGVYGVVHFHNEAVGVIPLDAEGFTWLVKQFRYTLNAYSWEIPEGGSPAGEGTEATARRELEEETGWVPGRLTEILRLHTSNSSTDESAVIYLAEDLQPGKMSPEPTEDIEVLRLPLSQAIEWAATGKITDAMSVAGLFKLERWLRERGRQPE